MLSIVCPKAIFGVATVVIPNLVLVLASVRAVSATCHKQLLIREVATMVALHDFIEWDRGAAFSKRQPRNEENACGPVLTKLANIDIT